MCKKLYLKILQKYKPLKYCKKVGVSVGKECEFVGINNFGSEPYLISIGNHVLITNVTFITHEGGHWVIKGLNPDMKDIFGYGRITIKDNVYVGYGTTILRGVTIGENTIIGARSLVNKSCEPNSVYAGIPAKRVCSIKEFEEKFLKDMPEYDEENYIHNKKEEVLKIVDKFTKK